MARWKSMYHRIKGHFAKRSAQEELKKQIEERNRNFGENMRNLREENE